MPVDIHLSRGTFDTCLRSRVLQALAIAAASLLIALPHLDNDGLWWGDASRHAANGLFWWDLLRAMPADPVAFTLSYYARYPAIEPVTYPPLFYLLEGVLFQVFGPSPQVAKALVLAFSALAGLYTMAWARRWLGIEAGWAGAFLLFLPGVVLWSNAIMLNVPAMAIVIAALYHWRRALEDRDVRHAAGAVAAVIAAFFTYYPAAPAVAVCAVWLARSGLGWPRQSGRRLRAAAIAAAVALVPVGVAAYLAPVYLSRHIPDAGFLLRPGTWTFYWKALPEIVGPLLLTLSLGLAAGLALSPRHRRELGFLASWIVVPILVFSPLRAYNSRYILFIAPAFVLLAAAGLVALAHRVRFAPALRAGAVAAALGAGALSTLQIRVPQTTGVRAAVDFLRDAAPSDAVLYDGPHGGLFGFYTRAFDEEFARRVVRGDRFLYAFGPSTTFRPRETVYIPGDQLVGAIRERCGCRWIAVERGPRAERLAPQRQLRAALSGGDFEHVQSFPMSGRGGSTRIDLYRIAGAVASNPKVDFAFPTMTTRTFHDIVPIERWRP